MNIQNLVTELQKKQVCVLHKPNSNFAIVFDEKKYIIEINANCLIRIWRITNNCNLAVKYVNNQFKTIDYCAIDAPLFVGETLNPKYFPQTNIIKEFDIPFYKGEKVDELFNDNKNVEDIDDLRSILTKILEAYS
ncbi:MAG: hypothetical protein II937_17510 [Bacteroidales bacterium]|nr:hypothetical protein [Bacteroidales bacterium]